MQQIDPSRSCAVAFKEWAGVCDALVQGRQTVIVRKGGISEGGGAGAFVPEYSEFWLHPTWLHQAEQGLRIDPGTTAQPDAAKPPGNNIVIRALVRVDQIVRIDSERMLPALEEFHIYTSETIERRFHYRRPGLWVLGARVFYRRTPITITATPEHAGCKTWVVLGDPLPINGLSPALPDDQWSAVRARLGSIL